MKVKKGQWALRLLVVSAFSASAVWVAPTRTIASATPPQLRDAEATNGKLLFEGWGWQSCFVPNQCVSPTTPYYDIWSVNSDGTDLTNLTHSPGIDADAQWSPDGSKIVFNSNRNGSYDIFVMDADGSDLQQLTNGPGGETYATWSPDGRRIAYVDDSRRTDQIVIMSGDGTVRRRLSTPFQLVWALAWSPDGRHIAFTRVIRKDPSRLTPENRYDVFLVRLDGTGFRRLTSRYNGLWSEDANWSPDGRHLVFDGGFDSDACKTPGCDDWSIFTIRRDGRRLRRIVSTGTHVFAPEWSPDGTTIAYTTDESDVSEGDIWFVDRSGDNERHTIIKPDTYDYEVDWQPVPTR